MATTNLSAALTTYKTLLAAAPASLIAVPPTFKIDDLPDGGYHRVFKLRIDGTPATQEIYGGGTLIEYESTFSLEIRWDPNVGGGDSVWVTATDDMLNAAAVLQKTSNRPAGILWVHPGEKLQAKGLNTDVVQAKGTFVVRHRETYDLT